MMGVGLLLLALGLGTGGPTLLAVVVVAGAGVLLANRSSSRSGGDVVARVILAPVCGKDKKSYVSFHKHDIALNSLMKDKSKHK